MRNNLSQRLVEHREEHMRSGLRAVPSQRDAEEAVRTLIAWAGDDPARPGLQDTPARVARAYREWFSGYRDDPLAVLERTFDEVAGYSEVVALRDIPIVSHCEHHLAAIHGVAHIAYIPDGRVVGISKLARLADVYSRRLQIQERLTAEIGTALEDALRPKGVAVVIRATHACLATRGVHKREAILSTQHFTGDFKKPPFREEFLRSLG